MRFRLAAASAAGLVLAALFCAGQARAAAEVHRLSLVLSASPTMVMGGDFNDAIDYFNKTQLAPTGLEEVKHIGFTWGYDAELRYFVRPNFAVNAGVSHIRALQKQEFLPAIGQSVDITAEVLTVPVHVGAAYYLQPYNQGDFQARAFFGAGLMQYTYTRATFEQLSVVPDTTGAMTFKTGLTQDAPGYYGEAGAHMFFASRWSVIISGYYRSGKLRNMRYDQLVDHAQPVPAPNVVATNVHGQPYTLDVSGVGLRLAAAFGF